MANKVEICNMALGLVGDESIMSLDDEKKTARLCQRYFKQALDEVLRSHPWNCAVERASLAQLDETPVNEFDYVYQLPVEPWCLRVLARMDTAGNYISKDYRIEGRKLLCDDSTCYIKYIKRVSIYGELDPLLVDAVAHRLAAKLAYPLTQSRSLTESLLKEYEFIVAEARSVDAMEDNQQPEVYSDWLNARY